MEEKYIKFYQSFHKGFQGKKSYSLFHSSQSQLNKIKRRIRRWFILNHGGIGLLGMDL